jgi:hypothetical protein
LLLHSETLTTDLVRVASKAAADRPLLLADDDRGEQRGSNSVSPTSG